MNNVFCKAKATSGTGVNVSQRIIWKLLHREVGLEDKRLYFTSFLLVRFISTADFLSFSLAIFPGETPLRSH